MKFSPLATVRRKPFALCFPGHRRLTILTVAGRRDVTGSRAIEKELGTMASWVCYVPGALTSLRFTSPATSWTCHQWRGRATRMVHDPSGSSFTSLRGALDGSPEECFSDLVRVLDWLDGYGIPPATIPTMSNNLFRASLSRSLSIGFEPAVARAGFYGGRQEARIQTDSTGRAKVYQHMVAVDLRAAYAHSMGTAPYGLSLRSVSPSSTLDPAVPGLAEARVDVPSDMPFGPLPVRLAPSVISFQTGPVRGIWPWVELAAARELGATVEVTRSWAPRETTDLFGPWWSLVQSADSLPTAGSRTLAKAIRNSLWGQFAMTGEDSSYTRWVDEKGERPFTVDKDPRTMPHAWTTHIAAETTARVRTRLLKEGLYGGGPGGPVHVDTDGIVVRKSHAAARPTGEGHGHWRTKAAMAKFDVRAPQLYRWTCGKGCGVTHPKWHYVAAGVPPEAARELFEREGSPATPIAHRAVFDVCVPGTHSAEAEEIAHLIREAKERAGV